MDKANTQRRNGGSGGSAGFTLVEVAVALLIVGIVTSGALVGVSQVVKGEKVRETRQKIDYVMNELSAYAQTHYRLPCPADPAAPAATAGHEGDNGKCFINSSNSAMYWETEGIVPWKELGIPQDMVVDAWGRYITYRPAPNLTLDNNSNTPTGQAQQDIPIGGVGADPGGVTGPNSPDIANACRNTMWYDSQGNHVNRAKALFCCNAQPKTAYLANVGQPTALDPNWRKTGVVDTTTAGTVAPSAAASLPDTTPTFLTANWADNGSNTAVNGAFNTPIYMGGAQAPLLRATGPAVSLISHGGDGLFAFLPEQPKTSLMGGRMTQSGGVTGVGYADAEAKNAWPAQMFAAVMGHPKVNDGSFDLLNGGNGKASDNIVAYLRTDQLFARVGDGSCEYPPNVAAEVYSCVPQSFTNPNPGVVGASNGYGLQLALSSGQKYQLRTSFTKTSTNPTEGFHNSLGFYVVGSDGTIQNTSLVADDAKPLVAGQTEFGTAPLDSTGTSLGVGLFIISDGAGENNFTNPSGANYIGNDTLKFENNLGNPANINDATQPLLYAVDANGNQTPVYGNDSAGNAASHPDDRNASTTKGIAHMNSNLNYDQVSHALTPQKVCSQTGGTVTRAGYNSALSCNNGDPGGHVTAIQQVGVLPTDSTVLQMAFEDEETVNTNCYVTAAGTCTSNKANAAQDSYGGYIASVGDNTFDDVSFQFKMTACPQGQ